MDRVVASYSYPHCLENNHCVNRSYVSLTKVAGIVHKDDLLQQMLGRPIDEAVDCPQQHRWPLVVEDDHDSSARKVIWVLHTLTPANTKTQNIIIRIGNLYSTFRISMRFTT